jgi:hypothetical protein
MRWRACCARFWTAAAGGGERARAPRSRKAAPESRARSATGSQVGKTDMRSGCSSAPVRVGRSGWCWFYWALTGKRSGPAPGQGHWLRRLGGRLGFGKASEGRIGCAGTSWSPVRGRPVDHLRVVPAGLLTGQHRGKGLGSPIGHRHREDPLGVPTTRRARRRRRGRAHSHPLLETAAVVAAILVGGHATLQGRQRSEASGPETRSMPTHPHRQESTGGSKVAAG